MESLNKYLWLSSVIAIALLAYSLWATVNSFSAGANNDLQFAIKLRYMANLAASYAPHIISSIWLWWAAKQEAISESAWSIFGFAFGMIAVAIFYGASIYYRDQTVKNENT